jgi:hypothetical protein
MKITKPELAPHFNIDDNGPLEPMPIYVTKTTLRTILKTNGVEQLHSLAKSSSISEDQEPKDSA